RPRYADGVEARTRHGEHAAGRARHGDGQTDVGELLRGLLALVAQLHVVGAARRAGDADLVEVARPPAAVQVGADARAADVPRGRRRLRAVGIVIARAEKHAVAVQAPVGAVVHARQM